MIHKMKLVQLKKLIKKAFKLSKITNTKNYGCIEQINPSVISGWVLSKDAQIVEVRLLQGSKVLGSTNVDIQRDDVSSKYNYENQTGFNLYLDLKMQIDGDEDPYLLALNADGKINFEIQFIKKDIETRGLLKKLLNSNLLGCDGFIRCVDSNGKVKGYAFNKFLDEPLDIWLQSENIKPLKVNCNLPIENLTDIELSSNKIPQISEINFNFSNQYENYIGRKIWFSFDLEGEFRIRQNNEIRVPNIIDLASNSSNNFINEIENNFLNEVEMKETINIKQSMDLLSRFASEIDTLEKNDNIHN
tara:strand:+ start:10527 stop:11435 length:909 start_codon:yes stop_codon:yes gene_type:complete